MGVVIFETVVPSGELQSCMLICSCRMGIMYPFCMRSVQLMFGLFTPVQLRGMFL